MIRTFSPLLLAALASLPGAAQPASIARDGFQLHYQVFGAGRPVLLLSGGPGMRAGYLAPVAEELGKSCRVILLQPRGTGASRPASITPETVNVRKYIEDFEALRVHLGLERWTVMGHSAGGNFAMEYAAAHPRRIDALVLVSSGGIAEDKENAVMDNILMRLTDAERDAFRQIRTNTAGGFSASMKLMTPGYFYDRRHVPEFAKTLDDPVLDYDTMQALMRNLYRPGYDLRPALKNFGAPVLLVYGRQDPIDPAVAWPIRMALRNSTLELIARCGHFPWIEQRERFYAMIRDFLGRAR